MIPEPDGTGQHCEEGIAVLDAHEDWFLVAVRERQNELPEEVTAVAASEPGERCGATGCDFGAFADRD